MTTRRLTAMLATANHVAFALLALVVAAGYAALIWGQLNYGLEYDESYLLNVVRNIASGRGFIDDGVSYFTSGTPFDPLISTGPTVLVPSAAMWKLSAGDITATRLVPIAFFAVYVAALFLLFFRWRGKWAALAALIGPLMLPILLPDLTNRSVMPGRLVGEISATALLLVLALLLARQRYAWAGLAGGLAIQAKLTFVLPVLVVLVVWFLGTWIAHSRPATRRLLRLLPGLLLPTLLFESYKLATLGSGGYARHIELTREFTAFNTVTLSDAPNAALAKLASLTQLASGPAILLCTAALGIFALLVMLEPHLRPSATENPRGTTDDAIGLVAALSGVLSLLMWWVLTSSQTSPRPAVPVAMTALALVSATMVIAAFSIASRSAGRLHALATLLPLCVVALLVLFTAYQGIKIVRNESGLRLLERQEQAATVIAGSTSVLPVDDFWTNPEFHLLTGMPYQSGTRDDPPILIYTSIRALIERGRAEATVFADNCDEVLFTSSDVLVCTPR